MKIEQYPSITTLTDTDLLLVETSSDSAYKSISVASLRAVLGVSNSGGTSSGGGTSSADTHYSQVSILCHFNGNSGDTSFTDEKAHFLTRVGNPVISTASSQYGGSSGYFDGSSYLSVSQDTSLTFADADFTWECWFRMVVDPSQANYAGLLGNAPSGSGNYGAFLCVHAGKLVLRHWINGNSSAVSINSVSANTWHHAAGVRMGTTLNVFLDGQKGYAGAIENINNDGSFFIGGTPNNGGYASFLFGYLDEVRITNSYARYDTNFNPATTPF